MNFSSIIVVFTLFSAIFAGCISNPAEAEQMQLSFEFYSLGNLPSRVSSNFEEGQLTMWVESTNGNTTEANIEIAGGARKSQTPTEAHYSYGIDRLLPMAPSSNQFMDLVVWANYPELLDYLAGQGLVEKNGQSYKFDCENFCNLICQFYSSCGGQSIVTMDMKDWPLGFKVEKEGGIFEFRNLTLNEELIAPLKVPAPARKGPCTPVPCGRIGNLSFEPGLEALLDSIEFKARFENQPYKIVGGITVAGIHKTSIVGTLDFEWNETLWVFSVAGTDSGSYFELRQEHGYNTQTVVPSGPYVSNEIDADYKIDDYFDLGFADLAQLSEVPDSVSFMQSKKLENGLAYAPQLWLSYESGSMLLRGSDLQAIYEILSTK
jgi:hypothetical protein